MNRVDSGPKPGWWKRALVGFIVAWIAVGAVSGVLLTFVARIAPRTQRMLTVAFAVLMFIVWPAAVGLWMVLFPRVLRALKDSAA